MTRLLALLLLGACGPFITEDEKGDWEDMDGDGVPWDEDCDDSDPNVSAQTSWYTDSDGDGYGDADAVERSCGQPPGAVTNADDCDDSNASTNPGADEVPYDDTDQDCDGVDLTDVDGDGHDGEDAGGDDCDDTDASVYPDAPDGAYDGIDQDCDGDPRDDLDGDGEDSVYAGGDDCDDTNGEISTDAEETWYDGIDQDCDGGSDYDADGDGVDSREGGGKDCDDSSADTRPDADEVCGDGVDNNCDGAADCGLADEQTASDADARLLGESKNDQAGASLDVIADWDGDGNDELLVGAPYSSRVATNGGAAYVVKSPFSGEISLTDASAILTATADNDEGGHAVASGGDVDADGIADLLVASWKSNSGGTDAGATYFFYGPVSGEVTLTGCDSAIVGDDAGDYAGQAVSGAHDLDDDGYMDLAIGAFGRSSSAGMAYTLLGPLTGDFLISFSPGTWAGEDAADEAGGAVALVEDTDGDGRDELLVGAAKAAGGGSSRGVAYLLLGSATGDGDLADSDALLLGEADNDGAGTAVSEAGDLDGDGYGDLLVGAPYEDSTASGAGVAYVVRGPVLGLFTLYNSDARLYGETGGDQAGAWVASAGDVNADGSPDLYIGAPEATPAGDGSGSAYVLYGPVEGDLNLGDADARIDGADTYAYLGSQGRGIPDATGDGLADLVVGAYGTRSTGTLSYQGAALIFQGGGL